MGIGPRAGAGTTAAAGRTTAAARSGARPAAADAGRCRPRPVQQRGEPGQGRVCRTPPGSAARRRARPASGWSAASPAASARRGRRSRRRCRPVARRGPRRTGRTASPRAALRGGRAGPGAERAARAARGGRACPLAVSGSSSSTTSAEGTRYGGEPLLQVRAQRRDELACPAGRPGRWRTARVCPPFAHRAVGGGPVVSPDEDGFQPSPRRRPRDGDLVPVPLAEPVQVLRVDAVGLEGQRRWASHLRRGRVRRRLHRRAGRRALR